MKRIFSIIIAVLVLMTSAVVVSASDVPVTNSDYIYFQVPTESSIAWKNFSTVFCHIWQEGDEGGDFYAWQAKDERCEDLGNGYFSYNLSGLTFKEDGTYSVIFSNENGMQTYNLSITSDCKGDIVVCEGDTCENPVDSEKTCAVARWLENGDRVHPCTAPSSSGLTLDPDAIFGEDVDLKWGSSTGVNIEFPEVEVPTEPETEAQIEVQDNDSDINSAVTTGTSKDVSVLPIIFIVGGILLVLALVVAIIVVVVIVAKKKK